MFIFIKYAGILYLCLYDIDLTLLFSVYEITI